MLPAHGQERRLQLRGGPGGAHLLQAGRGHHATPGRDQPGRHGHQQDPEMPARGARGPGAWLRVGPGDQEDDDDGRRAGVPVPAAERRDETANQGGARGAQGHTGGVPAGEGWRQRQGRRTLLSQHRSRSVGQQGYDAQHQQGLDQCLRVDVQLYFIVLVTLLRDVLVLRGFQASISSVM
jgi:hypothetical protein